MKSEWNVLLIVLATVGLAAFAGCVGEQGEEEAVGDEEPVIEEGPAADEDVGTGPAEPEPDAGPTEEEVAPNETEDIGGGEDELTV